MRVILGAIIGGAIGFILGYFGKCSSGACPITKNSLIITIIGVVLGALVAIKK